MFSDAGNFAAMILVLTDEGMKSSACLPEHLLSSSTTGSTSAFSLAYPSQSWWGRLAQDEQLRNRFSCAMPATGKFFSGEGETILEGEQLRLIHFLFETADEEFDDLQVFPGMICQKIASLSM